MYSWAGTLSGRHTHPVLARLPDTDMTTYSILIRPWGLPSTEVSNSLLLSCSSKTNGTVFIAGADACIIVYACNSPTSAERIESWFNAFVERCPLKDGQERDFPFICVGNKHDLVRSTQDKDLVHEKDVLGILKRICPPVEPNKSVSIDHKPSGMPSEYCLVRS